MHFKQNSQRNNYQKHLHGLKKSDGSQGVDEKLRSGRKRHLRRKRDNGRSRSIDKLETIFKRVNNGNTRIKPGPNCVYEAYWCSRTHDHQPKRFVKKRGEENISFCFFLSKSSNLSIFYPSSLSSSLSSHLSNLSLSSHLSFSLSQP